MDKISIIAHLFTSAMEGILTKFQKQVKCSHFYYYHKENSLYMNILYHLGVILFASIW